MNIKAMWQTVWNSRRVLLGGSLFALGAIACPVLVGIIPCQKFAIGLCIILAMAIGNAILYLFSRSFHVIKSHEGDKSHENEERRKEKSERSEVINIKRVIEEQLNLKEVEIAIDYRFANGYYADIVVLSKNGQYPMMCFEFANRAQKVDMCATELFNFMRNYKKQLDLFVVQKENDGGYQFFKVNGVGNYDLIKGLTSSDYDRAEKRTDMRLQSVQKRKMSFPVLFMGFSATPIVEVLLLQPCLVANINLVLWPPLLFWVTSVLAIMGIGVKGYVPSFEELA